MTPSPLPAPERKKPERRIIIVDDHPLVAEGWGRIIRAQIPSNIITATTALEGWRAWRAARPDLMVVDLTLGEHKVAGIKLIARRFDGVSGKELAALVDELKGKLGTGAVVALTEADGKATVAAGVTPDLVEKVSAVDLVQTAVAALGGKGGGGRPDRAQGGAPSLEALDQAIAAIEKVIADAA